MLPSWIATAVPASTGDTEAASVAGRTADHQTRAGVIAGTVTTTSGSLWEFGEIRFAFLDVRVAALLCLFAHVIEERRVAGQLLDAGKAVVRGIEPGLEHAQRKRAEVENPAAPLHGFLLQRCKWYDLVHEPHLQRFLRAVLLAQEPDFACFFLPDDASQQTRAIATVEAANLRAGLAEAGVVGGDGQVANDMKHMTAADRVPGDHCDDRLRQPPDLDLQVEHVEPSRALGIDVAVIATNSLVAA